MKTTLDYATPASVRRSGRELARDIVVGSIQVLVGLFNTVFLSVLLGSGGSRVDQIFERPRNMVRRGFVRIRKGRDAAKAYIS